MHKIYITLKTTLLIAILISFSSCGPKQRAAEGLLDNATAHYNQGIRKFDAGDLAEAEIQFEDALSLDKKYAPAHAGLALVFAAQGDNINDLKSKERREYFGQARDHLKKAKSLNDEDISVWIAQIRCFTIMKEGDDWIEDCEKGFKKAQKLNPESDEALYYMGLAYKNAFEFRKSEDMLRRALDIDGAWAEKSGRALEIVQKIVRAQPGTKYGKIIALEDEITRSDMAVLFIEELNVVQRIKAREATESRPDLSFKPEDHPALPPTESAQKIQDIEEHWAKSMIRDFVNTGIFEIAPDGKFYPDMPVTRIEFAGAVQRLIYMVTRDEKIFTKYIGEEESHIRDMRTDHPFYGAAMLAVERNIMDLDKMSGNFRPQEHIPGADALLFIRDIKNALKW